jgi:hypothetical protein
MRSILKSKLGRASAILAVAGLALTAIGSTAEARDWGHWDHGHYYNHGYWHGGPYYHGYGYAYRPYYNGYYAAPPAIYAPPPAYGYYGPPSLNFNIPL